MPLLSSLVKRRIDSIARTLRNIENPATFGIEVVQDDIRNLLRSPFVMGYTLKQEGNHFSFDRFTGTSEAGQKAISTTRSLFAELMSTQIADYAAYNPIRPQPEQRNKAFTLPMVLKMTHGEMPPRGRLFPKLQMGGFDQLRVLLCENASMLAFFTVMREDQYSPGDLAILNALTPALRTRLLVERDFGGATSADLLVAMLDTVGSAAFILNSRGGIVQANALGLSLWEKDASGLTDSLREAVIHPDGVSFIQLSTLRIPGLPSYHLAVHKQKPDDLAARVTAVSVKWHLTQKQIRILSLVAKGASNKAIATEVGVAEVTVESHLTKLFQIAQVENRASLVARIWST